MSVLPDDLRARIVAQHHTIMRTELIAAGVPAVDIARWRACSVIVDAAPGVYAVGDALRLEPFLTRAAAMSRSDDDAVCDALSSARVWGLPGLFAPSRPAFLSTGDLCGFEVIDRPDGIRVLSPAATWLSLASVLRPSHFERWSASIIPDRVTVRAAHEAVRRSADHRRRPDLRAIRFMSTRRNWQRPHWSERERRVRASLRRRGFVGLDGSHTIELPSGVALHPTVVDHRRKWAIEVDHRAWHRGRWSPATQRWLDRQLEHLGWTYVRVTDRQLDRDPHQAMAAIANSRPPEANAA